MAHITIVLTDGMSQNTTDTAYQASLAKRTGMYIFVVGIGQEVDRKEMRAIASSGDNVVNNYVFNVSDAGALSDIRNLLAINTCNVAAVRTTGRGKV